jgi:hypothetical protein
MSAAAPPAEAAQSRSLGLELESLCSFRRVIFCSRYVNDFHPLSGRSVLKSLSRKLIDTPYGVQL